MFERIILVFWGFVIIVVSITIGVSPDFSVQQMILAAAGLIITGMYFVTTAICESIEKSR